jgi:ankyrin repeat protein
VRKGEKDAVEALLKAGASAGIKDREGCTARDEAAASGQADLAKRLQGKSGPR